MNTQKTACSAKATQAKDTQAPLGRCPTCNSPLRYYDGCLGYEAARCDSCNYERDLNNASAQVLRSSQSEVGQPENVRDEKWLDNKRKWANAYGKVSILSEELEYLLAQRDELLATIRKLAWREWKGESVSWRTEAIEMQDEARAAISNAEKGRK